MRIVLRLHHPSADTPIYLSSYIPMVSLLLIFGLLLIFASSSGLGPLIYTLF